VKVIGLTGSSGSGKTTLLTAMTRVLVADGLTVSTVKHAHHGFDIDQPGKDSYRHREAGAREVLVASGARWALMHELDGPEPSLPELLGRLSPVDVVIVEGFKSNPHPKIEVWRQSLNRPPMWPERNDIVAVASDVRIPSCDKVILQLNDAKAIVTWMLRFLETDAAMQHPA
jgi:molybdopterin-guanine dinucleotide biosynthesis adapter protein